MDPKFYSEYNRIEEEHWWFVGRRHILDSLLSSRQQIGSGLRILDVGCGTGGSLFLFQKFGPTVGCDQEQKALAYCMERGARLLAQGSAENLPFRDESFDLVLALDVLEHVEEDAQVLHEFCRVCSARKHLLITVPAFEFLWGGQDIISHHRRRYRLPQLRDLLERAGFAVEKITYFNTFLFPVAALVRLAGRLRNRANPPAVHSDFSIGGSGAWNRVLGFIFKAEAPALLKWSFPFGVSILALATKIGDRGLSRISPDMNP
jgi:SAM-dependent methyltransferase